MTRGRKHILLWFAVLAVVGVGAYTFLPELSARAALWQCKGYAIGTEQGECAFHVINQKLHEGGMQAALRTFMVASAMFEGKLDIDCHAGIHRVGDMVYYDLYLNNPDISAYAFPHETMICNRGFYHGIFEHLFQDRPDPQFIVDTCRYFKNNPNQQMAGVRQTCFHAAGHGLFRNQAEQVRKEDWGKPDAFVNEPARVCANLPGADEYEKYNCTTGVESIFVQASLFREYGLSDPDPWNKLAVCDQLQPTLHPTCYFVRSLMVAQTDDHYWRVRDNCESASEKLFEDCVNGTIVGLLVNGVHERSFSKALEFCADSKVVQKDASDLCYSKLIKQLAIEYRANYKLDCQRFPEPYRQECALVLT